ncbi:hypothetical protein BDV95DRAFT_531943, partial [Massariosphaeria phaeospora]
MVYIAALVAIAVLLSSAQAIIFPNPYPSAEGHNKTAAIAQFPVFDYSTQGPDDPQHGPRKLTVSLFYPIEDTNCTAECVVPYMWDHAAKVSNAQFFGDKDAGVFEQFAFNTCCGSNATNDAAKLPLVVLEPEVATSRHLYSAIAKNLAENGVAVVTIDHPSDANALALDPFTAPQPSTDTAQRAIETRIQDINLVLGQLAQQPVLDAAFPYLSFRTAFNTTSPGALAILGHGLGGTVATALAASDPRYRFSINMDGPPPLLTRLTAAYTLFFGRETYRRDNDARWLAAWKMLTGKATEFDLQRGGHFDYSDLPVIATWQRPKYGEDKKVARGLGGLGVKAVNITADFVVGYAR